VLEVVEHTISALVIRETNTAEDFSVFWDFTPCSVVDAHRGFRGMYCVILQMELQIPEDSNHHSHHCENLKSHCSRVSIREGFSSNPNRTPAVMTKVFRDFSKSLRANAEVTL
jgi:hypothetical protein